MEDVTINTSVWCPDCKEIGGGHKMSFIGVNATEYRVKLGMSCDVCDCLMTFNSEEHYEDQWTHTHGRLEGLIKVRRKEAQQELFWKNYRELRALASDEFDRKKTSRDIQRRMQRWAQTELCRQASPMTLLDKFCSGKELPKNTGDKVTFKRPIPYTQD